VFRFQIESQDRRKVRLGRSPEAKIDHTPKDAEKFGTLNLRSDKIGAPYRDLYLSFDEAGPYLMGDHHGYADVVAGRFRLASKACPQSSR